MFRLPLSTMPNRAWGGFNGLGWSKSFRAHDIGLDEFSEDWYDRSAEECELFVNISQVDKYVFSCTVCRYFETGCEAEGLKGPKIVSLLKTAYKHDSTPPDTVKVRA